MIAETGVGGFAHLTGSDADSLATNDDAIGLCSELVLDLEAKTHALRFAESVSITLAGHR